METSQKKRKSRVERLLSVLEGQERVIVLAHDNPDPDAVAAGWGISVLVESALAIPCEFIAGGVITRAENRAFMAALTPPLKMVARWLPPPDAALILVDATYSPRLARISVRKKLAAVIDHHPGETQSSPSLSFRFRDVRPRMIASSSIVAGYLREKKVVPSARLATALVYGITSDATGCHAPYSRADRAILSWLFQYSDPQLLAQIESAALPRTYYQDLLLALENCFTYDRVALCILPRATGSELVGEMADLLRRCEGIQRLLCAGRIGDRMAFSARTSDTGGNAVELLGKVLEPEGGSWGGHEHRAGGSLDLGTLEAGVAELEDRIRSHWLEACGVEKQRGERLVPRREILKGLD